MREQWLETIALPATALSRHMASGLQLDATKVFLGGLKPELTKPDLVAWLALHKQPPQEDLKVVSGGSI